MISTSKRRPSLGEVRRKEMNKDIIDGKQRTLDTIWARSPSKQVTQCYFSPGKLWGTTPPQIGGFYRRFTRNIILTQLSCRKQSLKKEILEQ